MQQAKNQTNTTGGIPAGVVSEDPKCETEGSATHAVVRRHMKAQEDAVEAKSIRGQKIREGKAKAKATIPPHIVRANNHRRMMARMSPAERKAIEARERAKARREAKA